MKFWNNFWKEEEGQDLVELGLILALVSVVAIVTLTNMGTSISQVFTDVKTELDKRPAGA